MPAMPRDKAAANELASEDLDGAYARSACSPATLRGVRWAAAISQAVAISGRAWETSGAKRLINPEPMLSRQRFLLGRDVTLIAPRQAL